VPSEVSTADVEPDLSSPVLIVVTAPADEQLTSCVVPTLAPLMVTSAVPADKLPGGVAAGAGSEQPARPAVTATAAMSRLLVSITRT
jgi:hypothetical protein